MKIGFTYDLKTDWQKRDSDPTDINAEFDKPETIDLVVQALEAGGHKVERIGNVQNLIRVLDALDVDIVFNLCEGRMGRNRESLVPNLLQEWNIPFVGADALTQGITLDKVVAKRLFAEAGLPTAPFFEALPTDDLEKLNTIGYPLMVKTRHEGSSKGIDDQSRVTNLGELRKRVQFIYDRYKQSAIVEKFIPGPECTVPVLGNEEATAMPIIQVSIDGKTDLGNYIYTNRLIYSDTLQYICPAQFSKELTDKIQALSVAAFRSVQCRDLGRVDFRIDTAGNPYILEINPLPTLDLSDSFNIFPSLFGLTHADIINLVIEIAAARNGLTDKKETDILQPFKQEIVLK